MNQVAADRVDYRRGCAPIQGNKDFILYPYGRLNLRGMPAFVQMQDTVVVRKSNGAPWWTLRVGNLFGEPILTDTHVYAPTDRWSTVRPPPVGTAASGLDFRCQMSPEVHTGR